MPAKKKPTFVKLGIQNIPIGDIISWSYEEVVEPILDLSNPVKIKSTGNRIVPTFNVLFKNKKKGCLRGDEAVAAKNTMESI